MNGTLVYSSIRMLPNLTSPTYETSFSGRPTTDEHTYATRAI
jgi:hypothetical protein